MSITHTDTQSTHRHQLLACGTLAQGGNHSDMEPMERDFDFSGFFDQKDLETYKV